MKNFLHFGLVGALGFMVDGGLLEALVVLAGWGAVVARLVSFPAAVMVTWLLNRRFTFREARTVPAHRSLGRYLLVSLAGTAVNFATYTSLVFTSKALAAQPLLPLALASLLAMGVNYLGSRHFAFR